MLNKQDKEFMVYSKKVVKVNVGDTVTWLRDPNDYHSYWRIVGSFTGGYHYIGDEYVTYDHTFTQTGTYVYTNHVFSGCQNSNPNPATCPVGTIVVVEGGATDTIPPVVTVPSNLTFTVDSEATEDRFLSSSQYGTGIITATDNVVLSTILHSVILHVFSIYLLILSLQVKLVTGTWEPQR